MQLSVVFLLACLIPASGKKDAGSKAADAGSKAADCSAQDAKVAQLTAEVADLKKQLADLKAAPAQCAAQEISMLGAVSKTGEMASDVINHLLSKTEIDDKVTSIVSGQAQAASKLGSQVYEQITSHPCGSDFTYPFDYNSCFDHVTGHPIYKEHVAPHVKTLTTAAQPHLDTAKVHLNPHLETAAKHYATAAETVNVQVIPTLKQQSSLAAGHFNNLVSETPKHYNKIQGYIHKLLDPIFDAFKTASPKHHSVLPQHPLDRLLLVCFCLFFSFNAFFIVRFFLGLAVRILLIVCHILIRLGVKVPFKLTSMLLSWGFFFGTGFYVCGLCRRRKTETNGKSADAKAAPKKNGASKPVTEKELVTMLEKSKEKGKLQEGAKMLAQAAKNGKPLEGTDMKGKVVAKDVLKKALGCGKFKDVDVKKLGL